MPPSWQGTRTLATRHLDTGKPFWVLSETSPTSSNPLTQLRLAPAPRGQGVSHWCVPLVSAAGQRGHPRQGRGDTEQCLRMLDAQ